MRISFAFISLLFGVLSCAPKPAPLEPEPKPEPKPVPVFETSYEAIANMGVGWNLGNTLESLWAGDTDGRDWKKWETGWGQAVTRPELMIMMRDAGFGAIRVPVSWGVHMDASDKVYDEWMNRVNEVVDYVLDAGLYCIINIHHDTGADEELAWLVASPAGYSAARERYESLWKQIAERFRDYDSSLFVLDRLFDRADKSGQFVLDLLSLCRDHLGYFLGFREVHNNGYKSNKETEQFENEEGGNCKKSDCHRFYDSVGNVHFGGNIHTRCTKVCFKLCLLVFIEFKLFGELGCKLFEIDLNDTRFLIALLTEVVCRFRCFHRGNLHQVRENTSDTHRRKETDENL